VNNVVRVQAMMAATAKFRAWTYSAAGGCDESDHAETIAIGPSTKPGPASRRRSRRRNRRPRSGSIHA